MHMLHLLRHAKSSRRDESDDHQRPLSRRGREAAQRVGRDLPGAIGPLDLVLCSSAARTRQTLALVLAEFPSPPRCLIEDGLYLAGSERLLDRLRRLPETTASVLLIGHNPGLADLAASLVDLAAPQARPLARGKFPTAARASLRIATSWPELGQARHDLVGYVTVDSLPDLS